MPSLEGWLQLERNTRLANHDHGTLVCLELDDERLLISASYTRHGNAR
jgi:hypothetical protein